MIDRIKIKKGLDIKLKGSSEGYFKKNVEPAKLYALKPSDFHGITPKLLCKPGDEVKAGTPLFCNKSNPSIIFSSPVSGVVKEVNRGERRRILEVIVEASATQEYLEYSPVDVASSTKEVLTKELLDSGLWPFIVQRPYEIIANPQDNPKAIFISCFDSSPLAPDFDLVVLEEAKALQVAIDVLSKLTSGYIHLGLEGRKSSKVFESLTGVKKTSFEGPHPAGNVGTQIAKVDPINKGEVVWVVKIQDLISIGKRFISNNYDVSRIVGIVGSEVKKPFYTRTYLGANIESFLDEEVDRSKNLRYISGNVLTGTQITENGYLGAYDSQLTIIPEGNEYRFVGWITPNFNTFSVHRTLGSWWLRKPEYSLDANINGAERAMILSNEYDKVFPMDILPEFLFKAIITEDIDKMEQLGIYEIVPEDVALCEFVCTSKIELQKIVRKGLDLMIKEMM